MTAALLSAVLFALPRRAYAASFEAIVEDDVHSLAESARSLPDDGLTKEQRRRILSLTSIFEVGSEDFNYKIAEVPGSGDGRGLCGGIAGFCTATGDVLEVVRIYTGLRPRNELRRFIPLLTRLAQDDSDDVAGLKGFARAWNRAVENDPKFRLAQEKELEEAYFLPALGFASELGIRTPLGKAILYDTIVQHGSGEDPDGLQTIIARTDKAAGGRPKDGTVSETEWLKIFLSERRAVLAHANDEKTRQVWAESVSRVDALANLLADGNLSLSGPIRLRSKDFTERIR